MFVTRRVARVDSLARRFPRLQNRKGKPRRFTGDHHEKARNGPPRPPPRGFTDSFAIALGLWPLVSMFLTLPILAMLYRRDGRLRAPSVIGTYLSVLYVLGLGCLTLYPLPDGSAGPGITYGVPRELQPPRVHRRHRERRRAGGVPDRRERRLLRAARVHRKQAFCGSAPS